MFVKDIVEVTAGAAGGEDRVRVDGAYLYTHGKVMNMPGGTDPLKKNKEASVELGNLVRKLFTKYALAYKIYKRDGDGDGDVDTSKHMLLAVPQDLNLVSAAGARVLPSLPSGGEQRGKGRARARGAGVWILEADHILACSQSTAATQGRLCTVSRAHAPRASGSSIRWRGPIWAT